MLSATNNTRMEVGFLSTSLSMLFRLSGRLFVCIFEHDCSGCVCVLVLLVVVHSMHTSLFLVAMRSRICAHPPEALEQVGKACPFGLRLNMASSVLYALLA